MDVSGTLWTLRRELETSFFLFLFRLQSIVGILTYLVRGECIGMYVTQAGGGSSERRGYTYIHILDL